MSHYNLWAASEDGQRPNAHEAEAYHDMLEEMMEDEDYWNGLPHDTRQALFVVRDTLCWLLGHDNDAFALNIRKWVEQYSEHRGLGPRFDN